MIADPVIPSDWIAKPVRAAIRDLGATFQQDRGWERRTARTRPDPTAACHRDPRPTAGHYQPVSRLILPRLESIRVTSDASIAPPAIDRRPWRRARYAPFASQAINKPSAPKERCRCKIFLPPCLLYFTNQSYR